MEFLQYTAETVLMAGTVMLSRGGREEQDQAGLAVVWGYDAGVLEGGDAATIINSISEGGAKDIAKVIASDLAEFSLKLFYFRKLQW